MDLSEGIEKIERIQKSLIAAASMCRTSDSPSGMALLGRCLEGLNKVLETIGRTRTVLQLDFSKFTINGMNLSRVEEQCQGIIKTLSQMCTDKEAENAADKIEYELIPNLGFFSPGLRQLQLSDAGAFV